MRRQARFLLAPLCLVVLSTALAGQQSSVNLRPRSGVSDPGAPKVRVTVDRQRVPLGTQVTFTVSPASIVKDDRYTVILYFGDGATQVMRGSQTDHLYQAVGNYTYAIDVKSQRCAPGVVLKASPTSIAESETVKFSAQLSKGCPDIQYRFVFGDGSSSSWQNNAQAQHDYGKSGKYFAYVDIREPQGRIGGSPRKQVDVSSGSPRAKLSISLFLTPARARSGEPVTFTAKATPVQPDARYLFDFGDGIKTGWLASPQAQHVYANRGTYRASVQVIQSLNNQNVSATSIPAVLQVRSGGPPIPGPSPTPASSPTPSSSPGGPGSVSPTPSPTASGSPSGSPNAGGSPSPGQSGSPGSGTDSGTTGSGTPSASDSNFVNQTDNGSRKNFWWYLLIAALVLFLIYQASGLLFATQPTFTPFADPGVAAVADQKDGVPIGFELVLDSNVSGGDYFVTTDGSPLVKNAPQPEDRQVIEI